MSKRASLISVVVVSLVAFAVCGCTPPGGPRGDGVSAPSSQTYGQRAFKKSYARLEKILDRSDRQDDLPKFSLNPFSETRKSNNGKIRGLVQEVLEILELSRVTELADAHELRGREIQQAYDAIARHEREKITAPIDAPWYSRTKTKSQHGEAIHDKRSEIEQLKQDQAQLVVEIESEFRNAGITVTRQQVEFFLASISGHNALALNAVFSNVKQINQHLAELIRTSGEDAETAKKYYGLHVVLIEILVTGHGDSSQRIGQLYVPKVEALLIENKANRDETHQLLLRASDPSARKSLQANLRAQEITDKAGRLYLQYLERQKKRLDQAAAALQGKYAVARNTYKTAKTASALVNLIKSSDDDLASLRGMELPELVPFENAELQAKFEEIALKLKQDQ